MLQKVSAQVLGLEEFDEASVLIASSSRCGGSTKSCLLVGDFLGSRSVASLCRVKAEA